MTKVHFPYAAGVLLVRPGVVIDKGRIYTYYSEDYTSKVFKSFEERISYLRTLSIGSFSLLSRILRFKLSTSITSHDSMEFSW